MEAESDDGKVEYKYILTGKTKERIENLATQMRYRCHEGNGECIYNIGVQDDGTCTGITQTEYEQTMDILVSMAKKNNYHVSLLSTTKITDDLSIYEMFVRENNNEKYKEINIAVAGSVNMGKSSLVSVLTNGNLDDGRGSARIASCNFKHEMISGRTSSIGHHIMGFDNSGGIVNYNGIGSKMSWPEIVRSSSKIINILDLCGHEKYLKTTIRGLTSGNPDCCIILVAANKGVRNLDKKKVTNMTREHIFLCVSLGIPFIICVTKVDLVKDQGIRDIYDQTMEDIKAIVKNPGIRRHILKINNKDDMVVAAKQLYTNSIVPIFPVSNVSGEGLPLLKEFFNILQNKPRISDKTTSVKMRIDGIWSVPGTGTVVGGQLISGEISVNSKLFLGPVNNEYISITVRSIHRKRIPVQHVEAGTYVCLGLKKVERRLIRRGMMILSNKSEQKLIYKFSAKIKVLKTHSTTIRVGYQPIVHCSNIRHNVILSAIADKHNCRAITEDDGILRNGDTAICTFQFVNYPEYIEIGEQVLFAENRTKVVGTIIELH